MLALRLPTYSKLVIVIHWFQLEVLAWYILYCRVSSDYTDTCIGPKSFELVIFSFCWPCMSFLFSIKNLLGHWFQSHRLAGAVTHRVTHTCPWASAVMMLWSLWTTTKRSGQYRVLPYFIVTLEIIDYLGALGA